VRVVTARNASGPAAHTTESFERWGKIEAGSAAAHKVYRRIVAIFGDEKDDVMSSNEFRNGRIFVSAAPTGPAVTRQELVKQLPNHVTATARLAGKSYTASIPVVVEKRTTVVAT